MPIPIRSRDQLIAQVQAQHIASLGASIARLEKAVLACAREIPLYDKLLTIPGIGRVLGMTITMEVGDVKRFQTDGDFASYCRMVDARHLSNGKLKADNNQKCGNKYLSWAFVEAANFAKRYDPLCWVVVDGTTLQLHSPVDGELHAVNFDLLENPQRICDPTISSVWLVKIKTCDEGSSYTSLRSKKEIQRQYDEDLATFNKLLTESAGGSELVGITLQDGGLPFHTFPPGLSRIQYYEILKRAFRL